MRRIVLLVALLSVLTSSPGGAEAYRRVEEGQKLPDVTLETVDGKPSRLADNLGAKATVVIFWADWSPRSAEALRDMAALHRDNAAKGLSVWAVNVEHQEWDPGLLPVIRKAVEVSGAAYPVVVDKGLEYYSLIGVTAVPSLALLGPKGDIVRLLSGYPNMLRDDFRESVQALLEPPKAVATEVKPPAYAPKGLAERYLRMAILLWDKGQRKKALEYVNKSLAEDPAYPDANLALADIKETDGDLAGANEIRARFPEPTPGEAKPAEPIKQEQHHPPMTPQGEQVKQAVPAKKTETAK